MIRGWKRWTALLIGAVLILSFLPGGAVHAAGVTGADGIGHVSGNRWKHKEKPPIVIALDPGHDGSHAGTNAGGLREAEVNLDIALACRDELSHYKKVQVVMTRTTAACPRPGASSVICNRGRVKDMANAGASYYVSIHNNYSPSRGMSGAEVYYPNPSYRSEMNQKGAVLARSIVDELGALGLYNHGIAMRNSGDHTLYPDGSPADYYCVIRVSKLYNMTGIIIEHAYQSNPGDVDRFLRSKEGRTALGTADARGIARALGLARK